MFSFARKPQTVGDVISDGVKLYRQTLFGVLPISVLIILLGSMPALLQFFSGPASAPPPQTMQQFLHSSNIIILIVQVLFTPVLMAILIYAIYALALGRPFSWTDSINAIKPKLFSIFLAFFISTLSIIAGFFMMLFPGVFLSVMFMFCIPSIVLDNVGGFASLKTSWKLVWGNWWRSFVVIVIPVLISVFMMGILLSIAKQNALLLIVMNAIVMSLLTPLFYSVMLVQFNALKNALKEKPNP